MSVPAEISVALRHLAPDLKKAGYEYPDTAARGVTPEELRALIEALAALAPQVQYPAEPELRVVGPHGRFLVQARNGEMRVTSWSAQAGGGSLSPKQILAMILGLEVADLPATASPMDGGSPRPRTSARWKLVALVLAVLGSNGITVWMLTRPPPGLPNELLPRHQFVAPERASRIFAEYAGDYDTGAAEGDRHLTILRDGRARWFTWGPGRAPVDEMALTTQAAEARGRPVLVANNFGMIESKDPITIVYFGDVYRRKSP